MDKFRIILGSIQFLIENGNGASESELKNLWNELSNAISEHEQLNESKNVKLDHEHLEDSEYIEYVTDTLCYCKKCKQCFSIK